MAIALCEPTTIDISADIERFAELGVLSRLLKDRSTGRNIIWASNVFVDKGDSYAPGDEILPSDVTGANAGLIRARATKAAEAQAALTKAHAEVFTPKWIVDKMVDAADRAWWEAHDGATWQDYVRSPRLEITCGEAPFLVSRYDAATGELLPVWDRASILDRKLKAVGKHTTARKTWVKFAHLALKSSYGYEFQGDNLLIARVNMLSSLEEHAREQGYELPKTTIRMFANAISWNCWQMDGLSDTPPNFGSLTESVSESDCEYEPQMLPGMAEFFGITPAEDDERFVEKQMSIDAARIYEHLKVLWYDPDAAKVFPNTDIKGGVAITMRDSRKEYGPIGVFSKYLEMNAIRQKVSQVSPKSFSSVVYSAYLFHLSDTLYDEHASLKSRMSKGHAYDLKSNVFDKLQEVLYEEIPADAQEYVLLLGRMNNERVQRYIKKSYLRQVPNIDVFKVFLPKANGAGHFGEVLSQPVIMGPGTASTETFLSVGMLPDQDSAERVLSYLSTKFCRAMLGILKVTQDLTPGKFEQVPLQDFSSSSDIDWSKPIPEIDQQLYAKYGLSDEEIDFIESHVKEMD